MKTQTFENHVRVHPLYHYFAVPVTLALVPAGLINLYLEPGLHSVLVLVIAVMLHLTLFLARDYAKKNQDRIIRVELRLRYFELTGKRLEPIESGFSQGQLFALRFASDNQFLEFLSNPQTKTYKPVEIKRSIIQWNPDLMRV